MLDYKEVLNYIEDNKGLIELDELKEVADDDTISYLFKNGYIIDEDDYIVLTER